MSDRKVLERKLKEVENRLRGQPASLDLAFERARLLDRLGKTDDARKGYVSILQRDASHFGALNDLGMLLFRAGMRSDALTCFNAAVAKHPRNAIGRANLAFVLLRGGDARGAREQYEAALQLDPENAEARRGLALALGALGEEEPARRQAERAFRAQPVTVLPYRGEGPPVRVLLVVSASAGNVPVDRFLDDRVFAVSKVVAEYAGPSTVMPAHDEIFNAIGDADVAAQALTAAAAIVEQSGAPTINRPQAVLATGRAANAERLARISYAMAPRTLALSRGSLEDADAAAMLARRGFSFPILLRSPGFHAGTHFEKVATPQELQATVRTLPGETLFAIQYLDLHGDDGRFRKYRAMIVDGTLYPLHLAVSASWKVHYFSADMAQRPDSRAEEEAFLRDMPAVLGDRAMAALGAVADELALDYAGIDFTLDAAGRVVVFEANATMIVPTPGSDAIWNYRREPIARIETAVRTMLVERAVTSSLRE